MSFTTAATARRVPRYSPPGFAFAEPPDHAGPSQARPPSQSQARPPREGVTPPRPSRLPGSVVLMAGGEPLDMTERSDPHNPGIGPTRRRVIDLYRGGEVAARVVTYPDGPECRCDAWAERRECPHVLALVVNGHLPELAHLGLPKLPVAAGGGS